MTKGQKIKLVVFVLGCCAIGLGLLALFTRHTLLQSSSRYFVRVPGSVEGVSKGADVAVRGVPVGSVSQIELYADDLNSVRLTLEVKRGLPIMKNAVATFSYQGLTGLKFVEISGGDGRAGKLEPGSYIPYQPSLIERVSDQAEEVVAQANRMMQTATELLERVNEATSRIDVTRVDAILDATQQTVESFRAASGQLQRLIAQSGAPLQSTLRSADAAFRGAQAVTGEAKAVISKLDQTVTDVRGLVRANDNRLRVIGSNLEQASQSFKELGRELRERPSRLLISGAPPERRLP